MTDFPDLKVKALVSFPATIIDGIGIDTVKANGSYQFNLAYDDFVPPVTGLIDSAHQNALLWNNVTGTYTLANIALLGGSSGIPDAPVDGTIYGRRNAAWTPTATAVVPAVATPLIESGAGAVGISVKYAREDHVHPALGSTPLSQGQYLTGTSGAVVAVLPPLVDVVTGYGLDQTGATDVSTTLQTAVNAASTAGVSIYIKGGIYNLGTSQLSIPDGMIVVCDQDAIFRRSVDPANWATTYNAYTGAMISLGSRCRWTGGILDNTAVIGTSGTSNTIGTGTKTFTVAAGLPLAAGNFIRIWSSATPQNHYEGTVNSYSGTTLVLNATFALGSGTYTDWKITAGAVYQCPMVLHGVTKTVVSDVRVTGNWYVGLLMDGWTNPGGTLPVTYCTFENCWLEGVQNRGLYLYGTCNDNLIDNCFIDGKTGTTDYGINLNPAGSSNNQSRNKIADTTAKDFGGHGFGVSDANFYNTITGCTASGIAGTTGFLVQQANASVPQYNHITGCTANACGFGFNFAGVLYSGATACTAVVCGVGYLLTSQGGTSCTYISLTACSADSATAQGFWITGSAFDTDMIGIKSVANGTNGIQIDSGCANTLISGRSTGNTSSNLVNNGTGTSSGGLLTV